MSDDQFWDDLMRLHLADLLRPLTPEEAEKAFDEAEAEPMTDERIKELVEYATGDRNDG